MTHKSVVALDIGYSNLKMVWNGPDGVVKQLITPSGAAPLEDMPGHASNKPDLSGGELVTLPNGAQWVGGVSHRTPQQTARVLDERYPTTDAYHANFLASLARTQLSVIDVLVTGLPVSSFYSDRANVERLRTRLTGTHFINQNRATTVKEVAVIPQPVGACFSAAGEHNDLKAMDKRVLCLDPGFFSFDHVVVDGMSVRAKSSGSSTKATSTVLSLAAKDIQSEHGVKISREALEHMLQKSETTTTLVGKQIDVMPFIRKAIATVGPQIANEVLAAVRQESDSFDGVVLAGGGAHVFEPVLRQAFHPTPVYIPRNTVLANAKGYYLWGTR